MSARSGDCRHRWSLPWHRSKRMAGHVGRRLPRGRIQHAGLGFTPNQETVRKGVDVVAEGSADVGKVKGTSWSGSKTPISSEIELSGSGLTAKDCEILVALTRKYADSLAIV